MAFAPNVGRDADTENRSSLSGGEWRLPLTLAARWSEGRVGDVNVDAEDLTAGSVALLDAANEFDAICFILCCCKNAHQTATTYHDYVYHKADIQMHQLSTKP